MTSPVASHRFPIRVVVVAFATAISLALSSGAHAERADRDKPTNISYDHGVWDDLHQVYVFTGNVVLTKGTILLRCDRLTVRQDPEGYDFATAQMDGPNGLVYFHQKREGYADQYIEGVGQRIEYDEKNSDIKIFNHALVKRLEDEVPQDEMRGDTIEYNSDTEKYQVEAGDSGGRAHAIIAPPRPVAQDGAHPAGTKSTTPSPTKPRGLGAPELDLKASPSLKEKPNE